MSLLPGYILTDDMGEEIGLTLPEVATIVAEWDRGPSRGAVMSVDGPHRPLRITWDWYGEPSSLYVQRGQCGDRVYPSAEDVEAMRAALGEAAQ